jgi:uncharacterized Fe-S cluster-containing MiaB family protein
VAIGLETADPEVLERLNKRMTIEGFRRAAAFLHDHEIALRVFILLNPPFARADDGVPSACRSVDMAAECGATACSIIPTRGGNGAMEAIGDEFVPPRLAELESVIEHGLSRSRRAMRIFADLWDIERFFSCTCSPARATRLATMNRSQSISPRVNCECDRRSVRLQADRQT